MKPLLASIVLVAFGISLPLHAGDRHTFSIPSVIDLTYPSTLSVEPAPQIDAARREAVQLFSRQGIQLPDSAKKIRELLLLKCNDDKYAHILIAVGPPEITQEQVKKADSEDLKAFAKEIESQITKGYNASGIRVIGSFKTQKYTLPSGLVAIVTEHQYQMPDGRVRDNKKANIYTDRFTIICGIATAPDISHSTKVDIDSVIDSIRLRDASEPVNHSELQPPSDESTEYFGPAKQAFRQSSNNPLSFAFIIVCSLLSSIAAFIHNWNYRRKNNAAPSYFYGYFVGYYLLFWPLFLGLNQLSIPGISLGPVIGVIFAGALLFSIAGFFCVRRHAIAFGIGSILTLNPVFWLISIVYAFTGAKKVWPKKTIPPPLPPASEPRFITHDGTTQYEPMTRTQIAQAVAQGSLSTDHFYWAETGQEWKSISEII